MTRFVSVLAACLVLAVPVSAQSSDMEGPTIIRAARMLDVASGQMLEDVVIVVEDGVISAVNPSSVPESMHDMDLGDVTLLPGFIDAHTHLTGQIGAGTFTEAVTVTEAFGAFNAVKYGAITLRAGCENAGEFEIYVQLGMSELEALRTATIYAADLLDTPDRGALKAGMLADIIAVPGNPLDDITVTKDVRFVMLGGRVVKHVIDGRDMHSGGH